jgi:4-hydroxybenzoate polyprenyltransferase
MGLGSTIKEYGKLARSFNMAMTGMAPIFGALCMGERDPIRLVVLFILGCGAHIFGFVLNDYIDARIDKHSDELSERPLVSGTISPNGALGFALFGLAIMLGLGALLVWPALYPSMLILLAAAGSATLYNLISKKAPGMDVFVSGAVGLLALFGSASVSTDFTPLAYIIAFLAFMQVMFMNIVAGGLKDIDHDYAAGGRNLAIALGCKVIDRTKKKKKAHEDHRDNDLVIPIGFKALAHGIEIVFFICVLLPWFLSIGSVLPTPFPFPSEFRSFSIQFLVVFILGLAMMSVSTRLMAQRSFVRPQMRKLIGLHYALNFSLVPVMLSVVAWWIFLFALIPPLGFLIANKALHGEATAPKTM